MTNYMRMDQPNRMLQNVSRLRMNPVQFPQRFPSHPRMFQPPFRMVDNQALQRPPIMYNANQPMLNTTTNNNLSSNPHLGNMNQMLNGPDPVNTQYNVVPQNNFQPAYPPNVVGQPMNPQLIRSHFTPRMNSNMNNMNAIQRVHRFPDLPMMNLYGQSQVLPNDTIRVNQQPPIRNEFRIFIALYDYDPLIMSPNPTGFEEELPFKEGQLVKIYGDCDEDGFYVGECNGRFGLIPSNMVTEIEIDTRNEKPHRGTELRPDIHLQALKTNEGDKLRGVNNTNYHLDSNLFHTNDNQMGLLKVNNNNSGTTSQIRYPQPQSNTMKDTSIKISNQKRMNDPKDFRKFIAMYDYDPHVLSPNVDVEAELAFKVGDEIIVHGNMDEDGFYFGQSKNGNKGLVPSNFLQEVFDNNPNTRKNSISFK